MSEEGAAAAAGDMLPLLLFMLAVGAVVAVALVGAWFIGAKARHGGARTLPFESGIVPVGDAEELRLSVEFYLIAVFFVIFDLETIFVIAWTVAGTSSLGFAGITIPHRGDETAEAGAVLGDGGCVQTGRDVAGHQGRVRAGTKQVLEMKFRIEDGIRLERIHFA